MAEQPPHPDNLQLQIRDTAGLYWWRVIEADKAAPSGYWLVMDTRRSWKKAQSAERNGIKWLKEYRQGNDNKRRIMLGWSCGDSDQLELTDQVSPQTKGHE